MYQYPTETTKDVKVMRRVKVDIGSIGEVLEEVWVRNSEGEAGEFVKEGFGTGHDD